MSSPRRLSQALVVAIAICAVTSQVEAQRQAALDMANIEQITGLKGTFSKQEDVFKIMKPRNDVKPGPHSPAQTTRQSSMAISPCAKVNCRLC